MSSTLPSGEPAATAPEAAAEGLALLRAELDRLDEELHDTLLRRAAVVARVAALKNGAVALRPGREAEILRRLVARHRGPLPAQTVVRIWREMLAGMTAIQGRFAIAVADTTPELAYAQLAREHFGALTPLAVHRSAAQAIADVGAGRASAAVLPLPSEGEPAGAAWWRGLLHRDSTRIYIVGMLPFWAPRPESAPRAQALLVSAVAPDPTPADRSLLGLEAPAELSRARLIGGLTEAGFTLGRVLIQRDPRVAEADVLADVAGHVTDGDPRLAAIRPPLASPVVLGAYAIPIDQAEALGAGSETAAP